MTFGRTTHYARNEDMACYDCGHDCAYMGERFMLHDDVWWSLLDRGEAYTAGAMLCVGCVEQRLGRRLTSSDFLPCPLNHGGGYARSLRLRHRMAT